MKTNFTLLELLVVIAVIGLLMTILFPSLSEGRQKAKEVVCISNLNQIYSGILNFSRDNNQDVPHPTNFDTNRHWPRNIYPYINGDEFPSGSGNISNYMRNSPYRTVMYSPVVLERRTAKSENGMGRSDYGLNRFFLGTASKPTRKIISKDAVGDIEPMIVPINGPSNPCIWNTDLGTAEKDAAYFYAGDAKTLGLFLDGKVKYFTLAEGSSIDSEIGDKNYLE